MEQPDFTPEQQEYLNDLRKTFREEFEATNDATERARRNTIEELDELKADALEAIRHTLRHGNNEAIKARVAMWTVSTLLEAQKVKDDPVIQFLEGMPRVSAS